MWKPIIRSLFVYFEVMKTVCTANRIEWPELARSGANYCSTCLNRFGEFGNPNIPTFATQISCFCWHPRLWSRSIFPLIDSISMCLRSNILIRLAVTLLPIIADSPVIYVNQSVSVDCKWFGSHLSLFICCPFSVQRHSVAIVICKTFFLQMIVYTHFRWPHRIGWTNFVGHMVRW